MWKKDMIYSVYLQRAWKDLQEKVAGEHILTSTQWGGPNIEGLNLSCVTECV